MAPRFHLVSFNLCPFVQRSVITLEEKGVPYEIEYIDLAAKPPWFLEISPLGKVPVLRVSTDAGESVLFESAVINEYLDEVTPPRLMPEDPLERARCRAWIELGSALLGDGHRMQMARDEEAYRKASVNVRAKLALFEAELSDDGPLFLGERFSLVDTALASALQRITWAVGVFPDVDVFADVPRVRRWRDALLSRPSVQRSTLPEIHDIFVDYLRGGGSPARDAEPVWLASRL